MSTHPEAAPRAGAEAAPSRHLTFRLDGRVYAIPLGQVAEICPPRALNRLPHLPRAVEGMLELRGRLVPVMNLRERMSLPPAPEGSEGTILVLELAGSATGLRVDAVEGVLVVPEDARVPASPLLAGLGGAWAEGFILQGDQVITILDAAVVLHLGAGRTSSRERATALSLEERLDEDLRRLIDLAPPKEHGQAGARIIPQIESSISFTEQEVAKVLERVEGMLTSTDQAFRSIGFLKHEAGLGRLKGEERRIAELDKSTQELQDSVFGLIQQMQYQDIARQKLERVLVHLRGMQTVISGKLKTPA